MKRANYEAVAHIDQAEELLALRQPEQARESLELAGSLDQEIENSRRYQRVRKEINLALGSYEECEVCRTARGLFRKFLDLFLVHAKLIKN